MLILTCLQRKKYIYLHVCVHVCVLMLCCRMGGLSSRKLLPGQKRSAPPDELRPRDLLLWTTAWVQRRVCTCHPVISAVFGATITCDASTAPRICSCVRNNPVFFFSFFFWGGGGGAEEWISSKSVSGHSKLKTTWKFKKLYCWVELNSWAKY